MDSFLSSIPKPSESLGAEARGRVAAAIKETLAGTPARGFESSIEGIGGRERSFLWNINSLSGGSKPEKGRHFGRTGRDCAQRDAHPGKLVRIMDNPD